MEGVEKWLLLLYLPILAPLVLLTLFTWPWKIIGHSVRGLAMALRGTWRGYSRSSHGHRRRPFSFWKNMFLGCWLELAKQHEGRMGGNLSPATGRDLLAPAFLDTLLEATRETRQRISSELRTWTISYSVLAGFLLVVLVYGSHTPAAGNNSTAVDLVGMFAGVAFVLSLVAAGVYGRLGSLLNWAGTPEQFYWFITSWERALSGSSFASALIIMLTAAAGLAAAFEFYSGWVFVVLAFTTTMCIYAFLYFWSDSTWCPYNGAYVHYSQAFYRDLLGKESLLAHPSCCAFWELEPPVDTDIKGTIFDRMDRYLWRENVVSWYIASSSSGAELDKHGRPMNVRDDAAGGGGSGWPSLMRYTGSGTGNSNKAQQQGRLRKSNSGLQVVAEAGSSPPGAGSLPA